MYLSELMLFLNVHSTSFSNMVSALLSLLEKSYGSMTTRLRHFLCASLFWHPKYIATGGQNVPTILRSFL